MSAIRLVEVRGPLDDVQLRFHPGLTVIATTRGEHGRLADEIVELLAGRRTGAQLIAESGGDPVLPGALPESLVDGIVLRDADLRAALDAVRREHHDASASGGAQADAELAELTARRDELQVQLGQAVPVADGSGPDPLVQPLLDAWRSLVTNVDELGPPEVVEDINEIERRIRQAETVLRQPGRPQRVSPEDAALLRERHEALEAAQKGVEKRASRRALKSLETAEAGERELLDRLGIASYLDFVLGVATTSTNEPELSPDEATAQLVAAQADRQFALTAEERNAQRRELGTEVAAMRREIASVVGHDPGPDPEATLIAWRPDAASSDIESELRGIDERIAFLQSADHHDDSASLAVGDDLDEVLRRALADHPWPEDIGPLPILVDDALAVLDPDARVHALGILGQLSDEVQIIVLSDDARISDWGRAQGSAALVWDQQAAEAVALAAMNVPAAEFDLRDSTAAPAEDRGFVWSDYVEELRSDHDEPRRADDESVAPDRSLSDILGVFTSDSPMPDTGYNVVDFPEVPMRESSDVGMRESSEVGMRDPWDDVVDAATTADVTEITEFESVAEFAEPEAVDESVVDEVIAAEVVEAFLEDDEDHSSTDIDAAFQAFIAHDAVIDIEPVVVTPVDVTPYDVMPADIDIEATGLVTSASEPIAEPPAEPAAEPAVAETARDDFWVERDVEFDESWLAADAAHEANDAFAGMTPDQAYDAALDFEVRHEAAAEEAARREEAARLAAEAAARHEEEARIEAEATAQRLADELEQFKADEETRRRAEQVARDEAEAAARHLAEEAARVAAEDARREIEESARLAAEAAAAHAAEERRLREVAEAARIEAEARARHEAEEAAARAAEERRLREAAEQARLEAEEAARVAAAQAEEARQDAERMRREAEDEALIARLKAEAHAIIAAEDRAKIHEAEDARQEAELAATRALEMRERAEAERASRRETEHAAAMAIEAAARAEEAATRAAAEEERRHDDQAYLSRLEAELEAARRALEESRVRARDLARVEAQELAQRDAEQLAQRAALTQVRREDNEFSQREAETAAQRAMSAARRAEEAAARAEVAALQEAEDARLLERLEAEASSLRDSEAGAPRRDESATGPVSLFRSAPTSMPFGPQSQAEAMHSARRAEEAAARAEEAAARAETMLPDEARQVARSVRDEAVAARDHADRLSHRAREARSTPGIDPNAIYEAEEAARRAEVSAGRAEEAAARAEMMTSEDRLHVASGPWAGYDASAAATRAEEAAARAEEAASRAETMVSGDKGDAALNARRDAVDARHFADELARRANDLQDSSAHYDPVVLRDASEAARRAEISAARAEDAASRAEWLAMQEANRARAEAELYSKAAPPPELNALEAEELEQVADDHAPLYELPQEDINTGPMRGLRKRRAQKMARQVQRQQDELLDTAAKLTKRCVTHNLEDAVAVCGRCEKSYCRHCIVKVGSRGENLCVDCALQAAGVRSGSRNRRR